MNRAAAKVGITRVVATLTLAAALATIMSCADGGPTTQPIITVQPSGQTVLTGDTATFHVTADGGHLRYQWKKDGIAIAGATGAQYTTLPISLEDDQATFTVEVSNSAGSAVSSDARVSVVQLLALGDSMTRVITDTLTPLSFAVSLSFRDTIDLGVWTLAGKAQITSFAPAATAALVLPLPRKVESTDRSIYPRIVVPKTGIYVLKLVAKNCLPSKCASATGTFVVRVRSSPPTGPSGQHFVCHPREDHFEGYPCPSLEDEEALHYWPANGDPHLDDLWFWNPGAGTITVPIGVPDWMTASPATVTLPPFGGSNPVFVELTRSQTPLSPGIHSGRLTIGAADTVWGSGIEPVAFLRVDTPGGKTFLSESEGYSIIEAAAVSPSNELITVSGTHLKTFDPVTGPIATWGTLPEGREIDWFAQGRAFEFAPDSSLYALLLDGDTDHVWRLRTDGTWQRFGFAPPRDFAFTNDGTMYLLYDRALKRFDAPDGTITRAISLDSPNWKLLANPLDDKLYYTEGTELRSFDPKSEVERTVATVPRFSTVEVVDKHGNIYVQQPTEIGWVIVVYSRAGARIAELWPPGSARVMARYRDKLVGYWSVDANGERWYLALPANLR